MLIEFSVENFMSIKNKITFSMLAGNEKENLDNTFESGKERFLKSAVMYGANASGKTNILRAITVAVFNIRNSSIRQINQKMIEIIPFKFDKDTINKPTSFEFIFIANNQKYIYGFSADINKIYDEYLYQYLSAKPTKIFERKNVNEYEFNKTEQKELSEIVNKNTDNKLFLSTATLWNYQKTRIPFMWFVSNISSLNNYSTLADIVIGEFDKDNNGDLKKFAINLLSEADINLKDYDFQKKPMTMEQAVSMANNPVLSALLKNNNATETMLTSWKIITKHDIEDDDSNMNKYNLDIHEESEGTQNLFFLSPILRNAFLQGSTIIIDEIDRSLHPLLVKYIISLFHNPNINKNNAQLIFNTHDTNLLTLDIFRREQIWFVEKDYKKGTTDLYPLDDFSVRKTENIQKGYLNGRYGAIPFVVAGNSLWES
ncbi:MAG: ATP-binding protein [Oscillospiraceae bacterium]|nr:ATP-binding protein [Oscillospiraceae bacterium]